MQTVKPEARLLYVGDDTARGLLDLATVRGHLPEPIRVSHLIGAAMKHGESRGGA